MHAGTSSGQKGNGTHPSIDSGMGKGDTNGQANPWHDTAHVTDGCTDEPLPWHDNDSVNHGWDGQDGNDTWGPWTATDTGTSSGSGDSGYVGMVPVSPPITSCAATHASAAHSSAQMAASAADTASAAAATASHAADAAEEAYSETVTVLATCQQIGRRFRPCHNCQESLFIHKGNCLNPVCNRNPVTKAIAQLERNYTSQLREVHEELAVHRRQLDMLLNGNSPSSSSVAAPVVPGAYQQQLSQLTGIITEMVQSMSQQHSTVIPGNALDARPPTVRYNPPKPLDALAAAAAQLEQLAPSKDAPHVRPGDAQIEPKPHGAPPPQLDANPTLPSAGQHGTQQLGCPRWVANSARPPVSYHQVMPHHSKTTGVPVKARPMLKPLVADDNMKNTSHTSADHGADYGTEEAEVAAEDHHDDAVGGNAAAAADDDEHEGQQVPKRKKCKGKPKH